MKTEDPKAIRRFCGAVLEYRHVQPYKSHVKKAAEDVRDDSVTDEVHENTVEAMIMNIISSKRYPFELLQHRYKLPMTHVEFGARKNQFCLALAKRCGFPGGAQSSAFTKTDVLNMLFAIADEANECIVKDGAFNHQVASVALKAIDQAVRISGMCDEDPADTSNEIIMDETSRKLGA